MKEVGNRMKVRKIPFFVFGVTISTINSQQLNLCALDPYSTTLPPIKEATEKLGG